MGGGGGKYLCALTCSLHSVRAHKSHFRLRLNETRFIWTPGGVGPFVALRAEQEPKVLSFAEHTDAPKDEIYQDMLQAFLVVTGTGEFFKSIDSRT